MKTLSIDILTMEEDVRLDSALKAKFTQIVQPIKVLIIPTLGASGVMSTPTKAWDKTIKTGPTARKY